jgi:hypothetical protein
MQLLPLDRISTTFSLHLHSFIVILRPSCELIEGPVSTKSCPLSSLLITLFTTTIMHAAVGSLLRRGMEMGHAELQKDPQQTYKLPTWAAVLMGLTVLVFVVVSFMVSPTTADPHTPLTF